MKPRVLFLSPFEPWARENGSSVVIADLLAGLAGASDEVDVLPFYIRRPPPGVRSATPSIPGGTTLGIEPLPKWFSVPLALATGRAPWWEVRWNDRALARRIARDARARDFTPTVVHVEHLVLVPIGRFLARTFRCPLVYRAHNIESQLYKRVLGQGSALKRAFVRRLEQREASAIRACDLTLCISDVDLRWVRANVPGARAEVLPVGLQLDRFEAPVRDIIADRVCFVGGLDWPPNEVGLRWFVEKVFPSILERAPRTHLAVLARGADERSWLTGHPSIRLMPKDARPAELFASSRVSIAPLLEGGGVRVKILESLAAGCPVVATSIGGEGLELEGLFHTDDPATFADACLNRLEMPAEGSRATLQSALAMRHGAAVVARSLVGRWLATCGVNATAERGAVSAGV
jgi:polysaccharide biosynthesis protein PslH